ncbi:MAG: (2Fe-2S)-binding protein [Chloroflexi bacterium]|nr:(2Fe-2S)-binding protein [Chloroflexota bacterium]
MTEPVWERLRAGDARPLLVGAIRHEAVTVLRVVDGDLPDHEGATVFDAWTDGDAVVVRAASILERGVTPWELRASRLDIERSDGRLEALLAGSGVVATEGELERQACACRGISVDTAYRAIAAGWETVDAVKRATRIGFGPCQGRRCIPWLAARLELDPDDPLAQITPRPPLVPVPISILAAFADPVGPQPGRAMTRVRSRAASRRPR